MPANLYGSPIPDQLCSTVHEDPEPVMQQLVRVFIGEGTFARGTSSGPTYP